MDKMIKKVRKELDSIQHLINDVENKNLREHFKRSVKKIRKELSEFSKNESLHLVSNSLKCQWCDKQATNHINGSIACDEHKDYC